MLLLSLSSLFFYKYGTINIFPNNLIGIPMKCQHNINHRRIMNVNTQAKKPCALILNKKQQLIEDESSSNQTTTFPQKNMFL